MTIFQSETRIQNDASPTDHVAPVGGAAKRVFDIVFSCLALSASAVFLCLIAASIRLSSPGPVFFRHERIGFDGRPFGCIKFRTMRIDADKALKEHLASDENARSEFIRDRKLKDDPRIIPVLGHLLRKTSLDELPQFVNVLKGEMSVVGPRPVTRSELLRYGSQVAEYQSARPGITGLWQISGRSTVSYPERVAMDARYVKFWTFREDLRIILKTAGVVLRGSGAY